MTAPVTSFILAVQFLTRLPTPQVDAFEPTALSRASTFFPAVGLLVGLLLMLILWGGSLVDPWVGAVLALAAWTFITGALHLDGLSDLADALGAAHGDETRFHEVLKDPHIGTFGVVTLIVQLAAKLVLLMLLAEREIFWVFDSALRLGAPRPSFLGTLPAGATAPGRRNRRHG